MWSVLLGVSRIGQGGIVLSCISTLFSAGVGRISSSVRLKYSSISFTPSVGHYISYLLSLHCNFLYPPLSTISITEQDTTQLLFLDSNWGRFKQGLDVPEFHETIEAFEDYNQSVINKEGLALASQGCIVSILMDYINISIVSQ